MKIRDFYVEVGRKYRAVMCGFELKVNTLEK